MNIKNILEDLKQEYGKIIFPSFSEATYVSLMVIFVVIILSLLINVTDSFIGHAFNFIMF